MAGPHLSRLRECATQPATSEPHRQCTHVRCTIYECATQADFWTARGGFYVGCQEAQQLGYQGAAWYSLAGRCQPKLCRGERRGMMVINGSPMCDRKLPRRGVGAQGSGVQAAAARRGVRAQQARGRRHWPHLALSTLPSTAPGATGDPTAARHAPGGSTRWARCISPHISPHLPTRWARCAWPLLE